MDLEKMMADVCALRMRQLADWQADAARRSDDIRAVSDVLDGLPCRVGSGVWRCSDSSGGDSFVRLASGLPVYLFCGDV